MPGHPAVGEGGLSNTPRRSGHSYPYGSANKSGPSSGERCLLSLYLPPLRHLAWAQDPEPRARHHHRSMLADSKDSTGPDPENAHIPVCRSGRQVARKAAPGKVHGLFRHADEFGRTKPCTILRLAASAFCACTTVRLAASAFCVSGGCSSHSACASAVRNTISARYLLADPPPNTTLVLDTTRITRYPARVAQGARRAKGSAVVGSSSPRWSVMRGYDKSLRNLAARGW